MAKNYKIDALIMLSGDILIKKNVALYENTDTSTVDRPKSLDRKVERNINKEKYRQEFGIFYKYGQRFVAALLIVCTLSFAAVMSVKAVRTALWDVIVEFFDDYLSITYVVDTEVPTKLEEKKEPIISIEGWEKQVTLESNTMYCVVYYEKGTMILSYSQIILNDNDEWIDNENSIVEDVTVGDKSALLIFRINQQIYSLNWSDGVYSYTLDAHTPDISKEELISFAENIG